MLGGETKEKGLKVKLTRASLEDSTLVGVNTCMKSREPLLRPGK